VVGFFRVVPIAEVGRTCDRLGVRASAPCRSSASEACGDTVYGAAKLLKWLVDCELRPHVLMWDRRPDVGGVDCRMSAASSGYQAVSAAYSFVDGSIPSALPFH